MKSKMLREKEREADNLGKTIDEVRREMGF